MLHSAEYALPQFILSVRKSPEAWRTSFNSTLDLTRTPWFYLATLLLPSSIMQIQPLATKWDALNARRYAGAQIYRTQSVDVYYRHNDWIRKVIPKDRLLEHEASQGWKPICEFLGVSVPAEEVEYPHVNDTKEIRGWFMIGAAVGVVTWIFWIGVVVGLYWMLLS